MRKKNFCLISIIIIFSFLFISKVYAGKSAEISGYAWSPNIGWIDMNGIECNVPISGSGDSCNISGYAWSPNIGWVQFGNLSSFPSASGYSQINSKINFTSNDGQMNGWLRALSLITSGSKNNDNEFDSNGNSAESADGWASLRGGFHSVNCGPLVMNTEKECSGYAWGSNVLGWIDFENVKVKYPEPKLVLQASGGGAYGTQSSRDISLSSLPYMPSFRWTNSNSYLIKPGTQCYFFRSRNGELPKKIPVDQSSPTAYNFSSASVFDPSIVYNGTGDSSKTFFTTDDCGSYEYQLECATYGINSVSEPATVFSNKIVFNVCGVPSIDISGGCSVVNFNGANNISAGASCSGIPGISSVPSTFPASYDVSPGIYNLTCSSASKSVEVYGPTSPQCSVIIPGGNGQIKQPNWKEN